MPPSKIKIHITNNYPLFRESVKQSMSSFDDIEVVGEAANGQDLLDQLNSLKPEVVLMDIQMPVLNGFDTLPIIRSKHPSIKVIVISIHNSPTIMLRMLEQGANSYLTTEVGGNEIHEAILAVHKTWFYLSQDIRKAIVQLDLLTPKPPIEFSQKEIGIFKMLEEGKSEEEIAVQLQLGVRTVFAIIDRLTKKTGWSSKKGMLLFAKNNKLIG
jgi:DNA-binding NarL/FixJ family response regulator